MARWVSATRTLSLSARTAARTRAEVVGDARGAGGKQLAALVPPWEHVPPVRELRVDDHRVFYDVDAGARLVVIRAVRRKGRLTTKEIL